MYCPICGNKLEQLEFNDNVPEPDWSTATDSEVSAWISESADRVPDEAVKWICPTRKCFGDGFELIEHHPLRGMKSKPGDSWSLTWLK